MKKKMVKKIVAGLLAAAMVFTTVATSPVTTEAAAKSVTVSTQKQLDKALKDKKVTSIVIKTSAAKTFTIKSGKYTKKKLTVNGAKLKLVNKAVFKSIRVKDAKTVSERATGNTYTVTDKKVTLSVTNGASVKAITVSKGAEECRLKVNGTVKTVNVNTKAKLTVSGSTKKKIPVKVNAEGATVDTSVPVKTTLNADAEIVLQEGAEGSSVTTAKDVRADIKNGSKEEVVVTNASGEKIIVASGEKVTVASGESAEKNEEKQPETGDTSNGGSTSTGTTVVTPAETDTSKNITQYEGYTLVWNDEFSGKSLNIDDWNVEEHEPGWVNSELQRYVSEKENEESGNITVQDGNLVIKPIKTVDRDGNVSYTSGRINTQNKEDFTYGYFEVRAKVPSGMGYLPAFWMMPTDENIYGQWPRCGEIDIMEVMGQDTRTAYGTIHYGNPHNQGQETKTLTDGDFSSEYHTYAVDWEPGKITWYIDGVKYHEESDWYSTTEGQGTVTYPAPFDQPFYLILNLAVGGEWVGYPDDTTDFENQAFMIDYVRAYQKTDGYSEDGVTRPEKEDVVLREPDESGNYVINGDFAADDDLSGASDWQFLTAGTGAGSAEIVSDEQFGTGARAVKIATTNAGTLDYSIQFVQPHLPLDQGNIYTVTFDAYADEARTMIVDVSAPDRSYTRYLADTKVDLTTGKQTYTYTFKMEDEKDANGRIEFNLGNTASTATVYISNVRVEKTGTFEIDTTKQPLTDGNYIYNGSFQEGTTRMEYWTVTGDEKASYGVTGLADGRRLQIDTTDCAAASDVTLMQADLPLLENAKYAVSFSAELQGTEGSKDIKVTVAGVEKTVTLTAGKKNYNFSFGTGGTLTSKDIVFDLGINATVLLDDVRVEEDCLIKNGSFDAGLSGYEVYAYTTSDVSYTVDSLKEDNAFGITIKDTNDAEWKIQLKQDNVTLEKGQWYALKFDAKSSVERKIQYAIQRDGSDHQTADGKEDWTPYVQDIVKLSADYTTVEKIFQMTEDTDAESIFNIALGTLSGEERITGQHTICIDNISLEKVDAPQQGEIAVGTDLIQNGDFSSGAEKWESSIDGSGNTAATADFSQGKAVYTIENAGVNDWDVQLKQAGITLEEGASYKVSFEISSTAARTVKYALMNPSYDWYAGADISLDAGTVRTVSDTITITKDTSNAITFYISMGKFDGKDTAASTIEISNIHLEKIS